MKPLIWGLYLCAIFCTYHVKAKEKLELIAFESCPYVCLDGSDEGILVEIVKELFEKQNIDVDITFLPTKRAMLYIERDFKDGIIGVQRRQTTALTFPFEPIARSTKAFYVRSNDDWKFTGLNSLKEITLAVERGASYGIMDSYINHYQEDGKKVRLLSGQDILSRKIQLLKMGRINAFLADESTMDYMLSKQEDNSLIKAGTLPANNLYIALNNTKSSMQDIVSAGMKSMRASGRLEGILRKYGLSDWKSAAIAPLYNAVTAVTPSKIQKKIIKSGELVLESSVLPDSLYWDYAVEFKKLFENYTEGRFKVSLMFGHDNEHEIVMDVADTNVHMGLVATNNAVPYSSTLGVFSLPYMFSSIEKAKALFTHSKMQEINQRIADESGVRPLSFVIAGFRYILNNKRSVKSTKDLQGLRIRVPNNQFMIETFRAWGVEPVPMPWPKVFPALESNTIDGEENPLNIVFSGINRKKAVWESLKYVTKSRYYLFTAPHIISEAFYQQLDEDDKQKINKAAKEAAQIAWAEFVRREEALEEIAKSNGMEFTQPINEENDWKTKAKSVWPMFYHRSGGLKLVQEVSAILENE